MDGIVAEWSRNVQVGPYWDVVSACSFHGFDAPPMQLGVKNDSFHIAQRTGTAVAQYMYLVRAGLADAVLLFRGLERPMKFESDMEADGKILAYVWQPMLDVEWVGGRHTRAFPARREPPPGRVFVALVRPYQEPDEHGISGAILKWNWVHGDLTNGPIDGEEPRYRELVWRRS